MRKHTGPTGKHRPGGLAILHEDRDIIVFDKPAGLLTISTEREKSRTAYFILTDYVRKGVAKSRNRIFIVHRLDRETSGILIFAKNEEAKFRLQDQWQDTKKQYLAVVHGRCEKAADTITTFLAENQARGVYTTSDVRKGKLSHTAYKVLKETRDFSLLEVDLLTGRKHQIRVHLAGIGHPVVGDERYGKEHKRYPRLALHARSISFKHPFTGETMTFEAKIPAFFNTLVGPLPPTPARHAASVPP
jgi:tRNA pseudouridine32 synthase/23S rRNA pseudouridine746 synthase/23S rRNA pseudouridine1911/1915/1917 synthase